MPHLKQQGFHRSERLVSQRLHRDPLGRILTPGWRHPSAVCRKSVRNCLDNPLTRVTIPSRSNLILSQVAGRGVNASLTDQRDRGGLDAPDWGGFQVVRRFWGSRLVPVKFSLRTLLIFVALAQFPLVFYVSIRSRVNRESEAVKAILGDLPGKADRGERLFINKNTSRWVAVPSLAQERAAALGVEPWLYGISALKADRRTFDADATARFADLRSVQCLRLRHSRFDDSAALPGASFPHLTFLDLRGSALSDPMMAAIGKSHALDMLLLPDCTLPDESLSHLRGLKALKVLWLCRAHIVQQDWSFLRGLNQLDGLTACDITGSAIPLRHLPPSLTGFGARGSALDFSGQLPTLPNLIGIDFSRTQVTPDDLLMLIPKCPKLDSVSIMQGDLDPEEIHSIKRTFPTLTVYELPYSNVVPVEAE